MIIFYRGNKRNYEQVFSPTNQTQPQNEMFVLKDYLNKEYKDFLKAKKLHILEKPINLNINNNKCPTTNEIQILCQEIINGLFFQISDYYYNLEKKVNTLKKETKVCIEKFLKQKELFDLMYKENNRTENNKRTAYYDIHYSSNYDLFKDPYLFRQRVFCSRGGANSDSDLTISINNLHYGFFLKKVLFTPLEHYNNDNIIQIEQELQINIKYKQMIIKLYIKFYNYNLRLPYIARTEVFHIKTKNFFKSTTPFFPTQSLFNKFYKGNLNKIYYNSVFTPFFKEKVQCTKKIRDDTNLIKQFKLFVDYHQNISINQESIRYKNYKKFQYMNYQMSNNFLSFKKNNPKISSQIFLKVKKLTNHFLTESFQLFYILNILIIQKHNLNIKDFIKTSDINIFFRGYLIGINYKDKRYFLSFERFEFYKHKIGKLIALYNSNNLRFEVFLQFFRCDTNHKSITIELQLMVQHNNQRYNFCYFKKINFQPILLKIKRLWNIINKNKNVYNKFYHKNFKNLYNTNYNQTPIFLKKYTKKLEIIDKYDNKDYLKKLIKQITNNVVAKLSKNNKGLIIQDMFKKRYYV